MRSEEAQEKIKAHHRSMVADLNGRVAALGRALREGAGWEEAAHQVSVYLCDEVMPHALAEEATLYPAAAKKAEARLLVDAMMGEHALIRSCLDRIDTSQDAIEAYAQGCTVATLFEEHAQKENERLLPLLTQDPGVHLEELLEGMQEHLAPEEEAQDAQLDVREVPHAQRHSLIFGLFERLTPGQALVLTVDHDPRPLKYQLSALHPDGFSWEDQVQGPAVWRVALRKKATSKG